MVLVDLCWMVLVDLCWMVLVDLCWMVLVAAGQVWRSWQAGVVL